MGCGGVSCFAQLVCRLSASRSLEGASRGSVKRYAPARFGLLKYSSDRLVVICEASGELEFCASSSARAACMRVRPDGPAHVQVDDRRGQCVQRKCTAHPASNTQLSARSAWSHKVRPLVPQPPRAHGIGHQNNTEQNTKPRKS